MKRLYIASFRVVWKRAQIHRTRFISRTLRISADLLLMGALQLTKRLSDNNSLIWFVIPISSSSNSHKSCILNCYQFQFILRSLIKSTSSSRRFVPCGFKMHWIFRILIKHRNERGARQHASNKTGSSILVHSKEFSKSLWDSVEIYWISVNTARLKNSLLLYW